MDIYILRFWQQHEWRGEDRVFLSLPEAMQSVEVHSWQERDGVWYGLIDVFQYFAIFRRETESNS